MRAFPCYFFVENTQLSPYLTRKPGILSVCADLGLVLHEAERLLSVRSVDHHGLSTDTCHAAAAAAAKSGVLPVVVMMMVMVAVAGAAEGHGSYVVPRLWLLPIGLEENE